MRQKGIPLTGFKECDIRGVFGVEITPELAYRLGWAIGSKAVDQKVVVGGDFRKSTPQLLDELKRGLVSSAASVYDLGQLSTPGYYFARRKLGVKAGVMVTASHNPPDYNGFKPVLGDRPITPEEIEELKRTIGEGKTPPKSGSGRVKRVEIKDHYVEWLAGRFSGLGERAPRTIFDCGNGATGWVIDEVIAALGLDADVIFSEPDEAFPNRSPDIAKPNDLDALQMEVVSKGAALGAGFDGDGDRVGFVDEEGNRVSSDELIAYLARETLKHKPGGRVVFDVKLSRAVAETVEVYGGSGVVEKSGHTFIKNAMIEQDALFGGEYSGHLFFRELDGGDDGLFSALLVSSLIAETGKSFSETLVDISTYYSTPDLRIPYSGDKNLLIESASAHGLSQGARLVLVDGVKAEYDAGWALVRKSVTEPLVTFRFEGKTRTDMLDVAEKFLGGLGEVGKEVWNQVVKGK